MAAVGIRIASNRRRLASIACAKSGFISMKKHFLLIFTALLMGFSAVESFAAISPTSVSTLTVNKKLEPVSFSSNFIRVNGAYYYWGIKSGTGTNPYNTLPAGLTFNQLGVLSGVPTLAGNFSFTVHLYTRNGASVDNRSLTIQVVKASPPTITTTSPLPPGQMDVPYVQNTGGVNFKATGGIPFLPTRDKPTGYNWSLSWGKIPTGMTFNTVGALSGIPVLDRKLSGNFTQPQTFTFNITATDAVLGNNTKTFTLKVNPPEKPEILTDCPLPDGYQGALYHIVFLKAVKGKKEYSWSVSPRTPAPTLGANEFNRFPDGLKLSKAGAISGTPDVPGKFFFRLTVTDANGLSVEKDCSITIIPAPSIPDTEFPTCWTANKSIDQFCLTAKDGKPGYTWTIVGQSLPKDLVIDKNTGCITGVCKQGGNFSVIVKVTDKNGVVAQKAFSFRVYDELKITSDCPLVLSTNGTAYTAILTANGGKLGYAWSLPAPSTLPPDLVLDSITGQITGTPREVGNFSFSYKVSDACGNVATKNCSIEIKEKSTFLDCLKEIYIVVDCAFNYNHGCSEAEYEIYANNIFVMIANINNGGTYVESSGQVHNDYGDGTTTGAPNTFLPHPDDSDSSARYNRVLISGSLLSQIAGSSADGQTIDIKAKCVYTSCHSGGVGRLRVYKSNLSGGQFSQAVNVYDTQDAGSMQLEDGLTLSVGLCQNLASTISQAISSVGVMRTNRIDCSSRIVDLRRMAPNVSAKELSKIDHLVSAPFLIGKTEVTNEEYCVFLNAIAKQSDPSGLYNAAMGSTLNGGILRVGKAGSYTYTAKSGMENYPVLYVSWFDAARYVNWLANGSPTGLQDKTTTEDGAYALNGAVSGVSIVRNAINPNTKLKPTRWLLNESEWFTSAYLKSSDSTSVSLWNYPTQSDTPPDLKLANPKNLANYGNIFNGPTEVGFFSDSPSAFGTFDQGGNVREWTESVDSTKYRIIRGGSWVDSADAMKASESDVSDPTLEDDKTGFRIGGAP